MGVVSCIRVVNVAAAVAVHLLAPVNVARNRPRIRVQQHLVTVEAMSLRGRIGAVDAEPVGPARFEVFHLRAPDVALPIEGNPLRFIPVVMRVEQA